MNGLIQAGNKLRFWFSCSSLPCRAACIEESVQIWGFPTLLTHRNTSKQFYRAFTECLDHQPSMLHQNFPRNLPRRSLDYKYPKPKLWRQAYCKPQIAVWLSQHFWEWLLGPWGSSKMDEHLLLRADPDEPCRCDSVQDFRSVSQDAAFHVNQAAELHWHDGDLTKIARQGCREILPL